jgi:hypothetical protein
MPSRPMPGAWTTSSYRHAAFPLPSAKHPDVGTETCG